MLKPSARTHTAAPHCGAHCHQLRVCLTLQFLWQRRHNVNHQLSGAIFAELYALDGNAEHLRSAAALLGAEMADPSTDNFWSWCAPPY